MDPIRFDAFTRSLTSAASRRSALAGLVAGLLAPLFANSDAAAKRHRGGHVNDRQNRAAASRNGGNRVGTEKKKHKKKKKSPPPIPCTPSCAGKTCGPDGCGGVCGTCTGSQSCQSGTCVTACTPNCAGKACGAGDGCGGVCQSGSCGAGQTCVSGQCVSGGCSAGQVDCNGTCRECCTHDDCPGGVCQELSGTCGGPCQNHDQCGGPSCGNKVCGCVNGACIRCEPNETICEGACVSLQSCCPTDCHGGKTCLGSPGPYCICPPGLLDCNGTCFGCCRDEDCTGPTTPCQRRRCNNGTCELVQFNTCAPCFLESGGSGDCLDGECAPRPNCLCTGTC